MNIKIKHVTRPILFIQPTPEVWQKLLRTSWPSLILSEKQISYLIMTISSKIKMYHAVHGYMFNCMLLPATEDRT